MTYYNEIDKNAAQWLRNLIAAGHIAPGHVDERSIEEVTPNDLRGFIQCHFFAGIGIWSHALRAAGWSDARPAWSGSCPCQPFSTAGKGAGSADKRHLWPAWHRLIEQCKPETIFGEQVEAAIRHGWVDLVQSDLERSGYAVAFAGIPAAGVGAPHIRARLWFVAHAEQRSAGTQTTPADYREPQGDRPADWISGRGVSSGELGIANINGCEPRSETAKTTRHRHPIDAAGSSAGLPGPVNSFWRNADWISCRDGKWRPVEPGLEPLVTRNPGGMGRLRAYGNAICSQVAQEFISAAMEVL